jgi:hypothetical protein
MATALSPVAMAMAPNDCAVLRLSSRLVWLAFGIPAWAWAPPGRAAVDFEPEVSVGLAHTDNLALSTDNRESETVYELIPAFRLTDVAPRFTAEAAYRLEGYYYKNHRDSDAYHRLDANVTAALDPDNFFLEAGIGRDQIISDPSQPIPRSRLPISSNRVDRDEYYLGPKFQYLIGADVTASGSYRHSWIRYGDDTRFQSVFSSHSFEADTVALSLDNYRKQRGLSWAARLTSDKTDYGAPFRPWEYRQASVELGGWVGQGFRLFTVGGVESAWDRPFDPGLRDGFWEAGFSKQAGENFSALVAAGERTYGSSKRAVLNFGVSRVHAELAYAEQPTTPNRTGQGRLLNPENIDLLSRPGAIERYISKELNTTLTFEMNRTKLSLVAYDESREKRTRLDGVPLPNQSRDGQSLTATRELGPRTGVSVSYRRDRFEFAPGEDRDLVATILEGHRQLGLNTNLRLQYARYTEDSGAGGMADYVVNVVSVLLTRTF